MKTMYPDFHTVQPFHFLNPTSEQQEKKKRKKAKLWQREEEEERTSIGTVHEIDSSLWTLPSLLFFSLGKFAKKREGKRWGRTTESLWCGCKEIVERPLHWGLTYISFSQTRCQIENHIFELRDVRTGSSLRNHIGERAGWGRSESRRHGANRLTNESKQRNHSKVNPPFSDLSACPRG